MDGGLFDLLSRFVVASLSAPLSREICNDVVCQVTGVQDGSIGALYLKKMRSLMQKEAQRLRVMRNQQELDSTLLHSYYQISSRASATSRNISLSKKHRGTQAQLRGMEHRLGDFPSSARFIEYDHPADLCVTKRRTTTALSPVTMCDALATRDLRAFVESSSHATL